MRELAENEVVEGEAEKIHPVQPKKVNSLTIVNTIVLNKNNLVKKYLGLKQYIRGFIFKNL